MESVLLDLAGHPRSPATMPGHHRGRPPRTKGERYPADPPTVEEIVAVMRTVSDRADGHRLRALIVVLWRGGLRISEALALQESDLDRRPGCSSRPAREGRQAARGRAGPMGMGAARPMAGDPPPAPNRCAALRDPRTDCWTTLGSLSRTQATTSCGRRRGRPTTLRAAPAAARARSRNGARGSPAGGDPTATRACQPRHHQHLPPGHRQQRDHQHRPRTAIADDLRQRRSPGQAIATSHGVGRATAGRPKVRTPDWRIGGA